MGHYDDINERKKDFEGKLREASVENLGAMVSLVKEYLELLEQHNYVVEKTLVNKILLSLCIKVEELSSVAKD